MTVHKGWVGLAAASMAALVLAACGGDSGGSAAPSKEAYCAVAKELDAATAAFDSVEASGDTMKTVMGTMVEGVKKAEKVAPSDIKGDVGTLAEGFEQLEGLLADNDYNLEKVAADPKFAEITDNETFTTASNNVDAYNQKECGITNG